MTILTDKIVEKAARASYEFTHGIRDATPWQGAPVFVVAEYKAEARAALQAVLPDVVEEAEIAGALKAIAILQKVHAKNWDQEDFRESALAAMSVPAIRSLLNKEDGNG